MYCNRVFDRVLPGQSSHTGSWLFLFFFHPGLVSVPDGPDPKFENYAIGYKNKIHIEWPNSFQYLYPKKIWAG
jgi:hypothetical protein